MKINVTVKAPGGEKRLTAESGTLLCDILSMSHHRIDMPCGGRGVCHKCRVKAVGDLSPACEDEIRALGEEINNGIRLACLTRAMGDTAITLSDSDEFSSAVTEGISQKIKRDPLYKGCGAAIDIGTTTLAAELWRDGRVLSKATAKNPQTAYGGDVISRIQLALEKGGPEKLYSAVVDGINILISKLCRDAGICSSDIDYTVMTGNTAMMYLAARHVPLTLASTPFEADWLAGETVEGGAKPVKHGSLYIPRCMSAFVGADITTGILACGMTKSCRTSLMVDVGTNGEMALWHSGKLTCCSTAAGPAFEGAGIVCGMHGVPGAIDHIAVRDNDLTYTSIGGVRPEGICGSGIIDAISAMIKLGAVDETGYMSPETCVCPQRMTERDDGMVFILDGNVGIHEKDVRAVQLAKSAIRAGIETLLETAGISYDQLDDLYIAGGFGNYLDLRSAADIGLIPPKLLHKGRAIGNAALSGAAMILESRELISAARELADSALTVDLSTSPVFMDEYVDNMYFNQDEE